MTPETRRAETVGEAAPQRRDHARERRLGGGCIMKKKTLGARPTTQSPNQDVRRRLPDRPVVPERIEVPPCTSRAAVGHHRVLRESFAEVRLHDCYAHLEQARVLVLPPPPGGRPREVDQASWAPIGPRLVGSGRRTVTAPDQRARPGRLLVKRRSRVYVGQLPQRDAVAQPAQFADHAGGVRILPLAPDEVAVEVVELEPVWIDVEDVARDAM